MSRLIYIVVVGMTLLVLPLAVLAEEDDNADTTPPTPPQNLTVSAASTSKIDLSWESSTDETGVVGYQVWRNEKKIANVEKTSYQDKDLAAGTEYTYYVKAFDAAGNISESSNLVRASTLIPEAPAENPASQKASSSPPRSTPRTETPAKSSFVRRFLPYLAPNGNNVNYAGFNYDPQETDRIGVASLIAGFLGIVLIALNSLKERRRTEAK